LLLQNFNASAAKSSGMHNAAHGPMMVDAANDNDNHLVSTGTDTNTSL
jgi:hypothetical protein